MQFGLALLPLVACVLARVSLTEAACDCSAASNEETFCKSAFVLKVDVKDEAAVGDKLQYNVEIKTEYRATDEIDSAKKVVQVAKDADYCGKLSAGSTFFIMGNYEKDADGNSVLGVSGCGFAADVNDAAVTAILRADLSCGKRSNDELSLKDLLRRVILDDEPRQRKAIL